MTSLPEIQTGSPSRRAFRRLRRGTVLWFGVMLAALLVSRAALAPTYLVTFDDINFALSLKKFDPVQHQPQPPGYPLFVGLLRLFSVFVPQVEHLFLVVALFGSGVALVLLWAVGERLTGRNTGLVAALLLLFHPAFWFAALTNPIRIYLAVGAAGVALCLIHSLSSRRAALWYSIAAFVFGVAGGFRPDLLFTLFPLMLYTAWRLRLNIPQILSAVAVFLLPTFVWLAVLCIPVGGPAALITLMATYWRQQGGSTSPLLGAGLASSLGMAYRAVVWTFAAALSWLWCVPFVLRRGGRIFSRQQGEFLLVWLVPGFLFYALVHIGDPDHPLSLIPVTCIAGAVVLFKFAGGPSGRWLPAAIGAAVGLNVLFFVKPISRTAAAASFETVESLDTYMQQVVESIDALRNEGPVTAVAPEFVSGWRNISYYFPDVSVLVIESDDPQKPAGSRWYRGQRLALPVSAGTIQLPGCGTIAWIDPDARPVEEPGKPVQWMPGVPVTGMKTKPDALYKFRGYTFRAARQGCAPK